MTGRSGTEHAFFCRLCPLGLVGLMNVHGWSVAFLAGRGIAVSAAAAAMPLFLLIVGLIHWTSGASRPMTPSSVGAAAANSSAARVAADGAVSPFILCMQSTGDRGRDRVTPGLLAAAQNSFHRALLDRTHTIFSSPLQRGILRALLWRCMDQDQAKKTCLLKRFLQPSFRHGLGLGRTSAFLCNPRILDDPRQHGPGCRHAFVGMKGEWPTTPSRLFA